MSEFKTVYQIDKNTGEYIGEAYAYKNPMFEKDGIEFNIPAGCFEDAPGIKKEGFSQIRKDDKWEYIEDHRGEIYSIVDGSMKHHNELGILPEGYVKLKPEPFQKWNGKEWIDDIESKKEFEKQQNNNKIISELNEIDLKSIRSLREWLIGQPDAPKFIKDYEIQAAEKRAKFIK